MRTIPQMVVFQRPTTVSVVICTLNREEPLIHVLELLKDQTVSPLEILVVDQSAEHQPATLNYLKDNRDRVRLLTMTPPSMTAARNLARREARGDLILFLDDDVLFYPTLVQNHLENFQDPNLGAVSGKVLYDGSEENEFPWAARITRSGKYLRNFTTNQRCPVPTLYGCNMSIRRDVLEAVGEFDLNLWGNFLWEDVDYALRIRKHGYQILYDPRAAVFHVMAQKGGSRNLLPRQYMESTIFNDWYFFFKYLPAGFWPFLLYRQKRVWFRYLVANRGNSIPLFRQIIRAFQQAKSNQARSV